MRQMLVINYYYFFLIGLPINIKYQFIKNIDFIKDQLNSSIYTVQLKQLTLMCKLLTII